MVDEGRIKIKSAVCRSGIKGPGFENLSLSVLDSAPFAHGTPPELAVGVAMCPVSGWVCAY